MAAAPTTTSQTGGAPTSTSKASRITKKRPPGRPRSVQLDAPLKSVADIKPSPAIAKFAVSPQTPGPPPDPKPTATATQAPEPKQPKIHKLRRRKHVAEAKSSANETTPAETATPARRLTDLALPKPAHDPKPHRPPAHKVGVAPLHFGPITKASLRARARLHWLALAAAAAAVIGLACGYLVWLMYTGGLPRMASGIVTAGPRLWVEVVVLAAIYYIGRSIGHTAIIYGLAREADARPVGLGQQVGVGINTFSRRLALDLGFGLSELLIFATVTALVFTGGGTWPVSSELQLTALFIIFLLLLYAATALALTRGISGVALTLTNKAPLPAAKLGWRLFSHRLELIGWRFVMLILELILALPLAVIAVGLIVTVPSIWQPETVIVIGLLAWLAGALFGAGTASWWTALYRKLVTIEDRETAPALLTGQPATAARRGPLTLIVALTSFLIAAALAIPWLTIPKN